MDGRCTRARGKLGRVLGLQVDFDIVHRILQKGAKRESFRFILKAIQLSCGKFPNGEQEFKFQMCGRLSSQRSKGTIVDAAMNSLRRIPLNYF